MIVLVSKTMQRQAGCRAGSSVSHNFCHFTFILSIRVLRVYGLSVMVYVLTYKIQNSDLQQALIYNQIKDVLCTIVQTPWFLCILIRDGERIVGAYTKVQTAGALTTKVARSNLYTKKLQRFHSGGL
jgi:hypothetical protein